MSISGIPAAPRGPVDPELPEVSAAAGSPPSPAAEASDAGTRAGGGARSVAARLRHRFDPATVSVEAQIRNVKVHEFSPWRPSYRAIFDDARFVSDPSDPTLLNLMRAATIATKAGAKRSIYPHRAYKPAITAFHDPFADSR